MEYVLNESIIKAVFSAKVDCFTGKCVLYFTSVKRNLYLSSLTIQQLCGAAACGRTNCNV